jgi:hypothetical protein
LAIMLLWMINTSAESSSGENSWGHLKNLLQANQI